MWTNRARKKRPGAVKPQVRTGCVGRQGLEPRTCGLRARCSVPIFSSDLLSGDADAYRGLPFCPVAGICGSLRMPDAARAYWGIRANMEQTSVRTGLDHHGRGRLGERSAWLRTP